MTQYRLDILNHDRDLLYVLDGPSLLSLSYDLVLNDIGAIAFTISADHIAAENIQKYYFAHVRRRNPSSLLWQDEGTYFVLFIEPFTDENGRELFTYGGFSLEMLLRRRLIYPPDDPLVANGYSTKSGVGETVMHAYVQEQLGDMASGQRQVPGFLMGSSLGLGSSVGWRGRLDVLLEVLQTLSHKSGVDFKIAFDPDDGTLTFTTGQFGSTRTVSADSSNYYLFSLGRGNMVNPRLTLDYREEKNYCYALGAGNAENRTILPVNSSAATDTPYSRAEFTFEYTEADDATNLDILTAAQGEIANNKAVETLTFELANLSEYRNRWNLGDKVTAEYKGVRHNVRITKVTITIGENQQEIIAPTVEFIV